MSMSTNVIGIKLPDDKWIKMKAVWDACIIADVAAPDEVFEYFNHEEPDEKGVVVDLHNYENKQCVKKYETENQSGYEVNIEELPPDVKIIRFVNSW